MTTGVTSVLNFANCRHLHSIFVSFDKRFVCLHIAFIFSTAQPIAPSSPPPTSQVEWQKQPETREAGEVRFRKAAAALLEEHRKKNGNGDYELDEENWTSAGLDCSGEVAIKMLNPQLVRARTHRQLCNTCMIPPPFLATPLAWAITMLNLLHVVCTSASRCMLTYVRNSDDVVLRWVSTGTATHQQTCGWVHVG